MDISTDYFTPPKKKKRSKLFWILNTFLFLILAFNLTALIAYMTIPSIDNINDCFTTSMYKVDLCPKNRNYVRYGQLPKHLVGALVISEDSTFFFHNGFDWDEIQDSLEKSMDAGRWVRGGSTLTQQLAKNLYLYKDKSLVRKMKEFFIAKRIEEKLSKAQIIEKYFNVVEFGRNIYGVQAASLHYFKKSVGAITPAEGAYLISLLPSPVRYSSTYESKKDLSSFNKKRVVHILSLLLHTGKISPETYEYERGRTLNGLWNAYSPTTEEGVYWVNGEKKTSESSELVPEPGTKLQDLHDATPSDEDTSESPALEEDYE